MTELQVEQRRETASESTPPAVRWMLWAALALAFAGGLYLYAVRGAAMLLDLATAMCL
jgi:hypothetical protein